MKNKKIYGFVLLALIIMLLPIGMVSAKYKQTKEVGTVTLDIAPPILSPNWKTKLTKANTTLIVDSFTPEADPNRYSSFSWDDGNPVGYDSSNENGFKSNVRLFEDNGTAYILAIGNNPVTFPENSSSLFHDDRWYLSGVEKIDFKNINTSNVVDMSNMFIYCANLKRLDASGFNTSNVEDMSNMFFNCARLTSLDVSNFNTSNVTDMNNMFAGCSDMTSLTLGVNFNTSNVTNMADMFNGCSSLTNLDVKQFDTSKVTNMSQMFNNCKDLTTLDLSNFNTSQVTDMSSMFNTCERLTSLNISSFNTFNVTNMKNMFGSCYALTALDLSNFTTPYLIDMNNMFYNCNGLVSLDLRNFSTLDNTNMSNLFTDCSQLKQVTLGAEFKFINYSADTTVLLPGQKNVDIPGANGKWYISNSGQGYNSTEVAVYHNEHKTMTTYFAVQSEAPPSTNTFSLLTENGTINGAIQGN